MLDTEQMDVAERQPERSLRVDVWRGGKDGAFSTYTVPWRENQTVLDVVTEIQRHHEPALAYRFACRVGVCGSCAMTVNGVPALDLPHACAPGRGRRAHHDRAAAQHAGHQGPGLRHDGVLRQVAEAGGHLRARRRAKDAPIAVDPASKKRRNADRGIECINCGICYAACDVVSWNEDYLGPAALNRAWTLVNDERHAAKRETLRKVTNRAAAALAIRREAA